MCAVAEERDGADRKQQWIASLNSTVCSMDAGDLSEKVDYPEAPGFRRIPSKHPHEFCEYL
jgi:hypothetical protein